jgi:proteasome accessory factor C
LLWWRRPKNRPLVYPEEWINAEVEAGLAAVVESHEGEPTKPPRASAPKRVGAVIERPAGPVAPERFGVLQALLAYLLDRCGERSSATLPADELVERFHIPADQLDDHLQLLNLVNFGGGCYAVYASLADGEVHVEKELFGDTFRKPPRLTPLEARAIRLALEFVGPMIAAEAHTPLERVRKKLEQTFGEFELPAPRQQEGGSSQEALIGTFTQAIAAQRVVEIDYTKPSGETITRTVEPYALERELPWWYVHGWDRTAEAQRSFRLDRIRRADAGDEAFDPRPGFEPRKLADAGIARVLFSPAVARWRTERGATPLARGYAIDDLRFGGVDWLVGEILSYRGEAELLEPASLRREVLRRAKKLRKAIQPLSTARGRSRATR